MTVFTAMAVVWVACNKENDILSDSFKNNDTYQPFSSLPEPSEFQQDSLTLTLISKWLEIKVTDVDVETLNNIVEDNEITEPELLSSALGFNSYEEYIDYLSEIQVLMSQLNTKYSLVEMSPEELNSEFYYATLYFISSQGSGSSDCGEMYTYCMAGVTVTALYGHIACGAADLFPIVGVLCHASVIAAQLVGYDGCNNSYNACLTSQNGGYENGIYPEIDSYIIGLFY